VPSEPNTFGNTRNRMLRAGEPKVEQGKFVPRYTELGDPGRKRPAGQRAFEGETIAMRGELVEPIKHDPARMNGRALRVKGRQASSDDVGIHKL